MPNIFGFITDFAIKVGILPEKESLWNIEPVGVINKKLGNIWISQPLAVNEVLIISGHVEQGNYLTRVKIEQAGLMLVDDLAAPGFCLKIPLKVGVYILSLWHNSDLIGKWEIIPAERALAAANGMLFPHGPSSINNDIDEPYAIIGRMGDLFLAGDSNNSVSQYTEDRSLSLSSVAAWEDVFRRMPVWKEKFSLKKISLLIAPAKEEIRREYYPFPRAKDNLLDSFLRHFRDHNLIFPKWELWGRRDIAFSNTDTHWTDYGATVAASTVLKAWDIDTSGLPDSFRIIQKIGDLGNKVNPKVSSFEVSFLSDVSKKIIYTNGVNNQGNIRIFFNPKAVENARLLIFGDSFGTNLAEALTAYFSNVFYVYQPAGFDSDFVSLVNPNYVLLEITQRFLHGQPATESSIFSKAADKLKTSPVVQRDIFLEEISKLNNLNNTYGHVA